jgi:hypothetical protein
MPLRISELRASTLKTAKASLPMSIKALPSLAMVLMGVVWLVGCDKRTVTTSGVTPFIYGQEDVTGHLRKNGIEVEVVSHVRRNASGTELFVYLFDSPTNRFPVIRITTNGVDRLSAPGHSAVPGVDGSFVVWGSEKGNGIQFQNGYLLNLPQFGLFDIDPGGIYFVIGEKPNTTWLGRVSSPEDRVMIAGDMLASGVFVSRGSIYITGDSYVQNSRGDREPLTTCLVVSGEGDEFKVVERLEFDWSSGVVELDPFADRLLLWDRALVSHSMYLFDVTTKRRERLGRVGGFEFFLTSDLLR